MKNQKHLIFFLSMLFCIFTQAQAQTLYPGLRVPMASTAEMKNISSMRDAKWASNSILKRQNNLIWGAGYDDNMQKFTHHLVSGIVETSFGVPFVIGGSILLSTGVNRLRNDNGYYDNNISLVYAIVGGSLLLTGIPLIITGPINIGRAVHYKHMASKDKTSMSFLPACMPAGSGHSASMSLGGAMNIQF